MSIKWLNLQQKATNYTPNFNADNYSFLPDIFHIKNIDDNYLFFAPLLLRIYLIPKKYITNLPPLKFDQKYKEEFIKSSLIMSTDKIKELVPSTKKPEYSNHIRLLLTSGCGLNCSYCYGNAQKKGKTIKPELVTNLINNLPEKSSLTVDLHANGEPTLAIKKMKQIITIIKEKHPRASFNMQTNGLFNKKTADWLINNKIHTAFSLDGPEFIHNKQRPAYNPKVNSFKKLRKNLEYFQKNNQGFMTITTVTAYITPYLTEIYEFLKQQNIKYMKINPLVKLGKASLKNDELHDPPDIQYFAEQLAIIQEKAYFDKILIDSDFLPSFHIRQPSAYRCGATVPQIVLDHTGLILACSDGYYADEQNTNPFFWAKLHNQQIEVDNIKQNHLKRSSLSMPSCIKCPLKWQCAGGCLVENYIINKNIETPSTEHCLAKILFMNNYFTSLAKRYLL